MVSYSLGDCDTWFRGPTRVCSVLHEFCVIHDTVRFREWTACVCESKLELIHGSLELCLPTNGIAIGSVVLRNSRPRRDHQTHTATNHFIPLVAIGGICDMRATRAKTYRSKAGKWARTARTMGVGKLYAIPESQQSATSESMKGRVKLLAWLAAPSLLTRENSPESNYLQTQRCRLWCFSSKVIKSCKHNIHCVPKKRLPLIFGITLSKLTDFNDFWHVKAWENLTWKLADLPTSPVRCSYFTLGNQKSHFRQHYPYILLITCVISEENKL